MKEKVLRYYYQSADYAGVHLHAQEDMKRLGLNNYYKAEAYTIGGCWLFYFKEWPKVEIPAYIQTIEIDSETNDVKKVNIRDGEK